MLKVKYLMCSFVPETKMTPSHLAVLKTDIYYIDSDRSCYGTHNVCEQKVRH